MNKLVSFQPIHGLAMTGQQAQDVPTRTKLMLGPDKWREVAERGSGRCFSGLNEGLVFACGGVLQQHYGRCQAWVMLSKEISRSQLLWFTRETIRFLDKLQEDPEYRRVEATARADSVQAVRWCELLGFKKEGLLEGYDADGNDHIAYARVRWPLKPPQ